MDEKSTTYPMILVFYLNADMMKQRDIIQPFVDSVNQMLLHKEANALAFFIPTNETERIECINPVTMKEADMENVNKIIEDLKKNFMVDINVPDQEITLDEKPCVCKDGGECNCNNNE